MKLGTAELTLQEIDRELVILDLADSIYLTPKGSGTFLAKLLPEERTENEFTEAVEYDLHAETAIRDAAVSTVQLAEKNSLVTP